MKTNKEEFESMVEECFTELSSAYKEKYDVEKADRTAALFLATQMQLALFIEDVELKARHSKNEIERIEAIKYFEVKNDAASGKKTEASLDQFIAKDNDVIEAKRENSEAESELKKFNYLMSSLKDGVYFFRGVGKNKGTWNE
jgi:hypothetical protein